MKTIWKFIGVAAFWVGWPVLWLALRPTTRTRVIILNAKGEILFVKGWVGSGKWILPGGGVHSGEDPVLGAIREVNEEVGLQLMPDQFKQFDEGLANEHGIRFRYIAYQVSLSDSPDLRRQKREITDAGWLPPEGQPGLSPFTASILAAWSVKRHLLK